MIAKYNARLRCMKCDKETIHLWYTTGDFKGEWRCARCQRFSEYSDDLSDIAKAATSRLEEIQ